jgi:hypothetical protein
MNTSLLNAISSVFKAEIMLRTQGSTGILNSKNTDMFTKAQSVSDVISIYSKEFYAVKSDNKGFLAKRGNQLFFTSHNDKIIVTATPETGEVCISSDHQLNLNPTNPEDCVILYLTLEKDETCTLRKEAEKIALPFLEKHYNEFFSKLSLRTA